MEEKSYFDIYKERGQEKRYAFEWFVLENDMQYFGTTMDEINKLKKLIKRITALAVTSTVIATVALLIILFR